MSLKNPLFLIGGSPGTGKTTITKYLSNEYEIIELSQFILENGLYLGYDWKKDSIIIDNEALQLELMKLPRERSTIIEGHAIDLIPRTMVTYCIILRLNPGVMRQRLSDRGYSENKIEENIEAEIMEICYWDAVDAFGEERVKMLDTTNISIDTLVTEVKSIFKIL